MTGIDDFFKQIFPPGKPNQGLSPEALARREKRTRGVIHSGRPGQVITMSRGREYLVAPDGSFRRIRKAA
jgi:hypothetical protein